MKRAMGIVQPMVKVPQELSARAFTTASPKPDRAITIINRMASEAMMPGKVPNSSCAICARDLPLCRIEAVRMMKS